MTTDFIYQFIRKHTLAMTGSINKEDRHEVALVGIAVTPVLEMICGTVTISRKYSNVMVQPEVALVIGWDDETIVKCENIANPGKVHHHGWDLSAFRSPQNGYATVILMARIIMELRF